jgi:hypothetical protein
MTNKKAMEKVLKLAELGNSTAQVKGLDGKRLTDKEREEYPEAIYQMQVFLVKDNYKNNVLTGGLNEEI